MTQAAFLILFLLAPAGIVLLTRASARAARAGPIVLCYAAGLLLGLAGLLPEAADAPRNTVTEASLGLALPLLLFGVDIRAWGQVAGRAMLSMFLAIVAVVSVAVALYHLFAARGVAEAEQLSGMAVGMYTGGIANLGAIKLALGIPDDRYLLFATVDTVVGAVYLVFVLTLAPRLFAHWLPEFPEGARIEGDAAQEGPRHDRRRLLTDGVVALLAAGACVGLAVGLAPLIPWGEEQIAVIVLLTTLGLAASLIGPLRRNAAATPVGLYLIYVFSFCVAAAMDLTALAGMDMAVLGFVVFATFGSLALHAVLCRLVRVDRDTFLITSVAALMSPAFVPMVARSLRNPAILMSGMATGILGFAIGNYLGISVALLLAKG